MTCLFLKIDEEILKNLFLLCLSNDNGTTGWSTNPPLSLQVWQGPTLSRQALLMRKGFMGVSYMTMFSWYGDVLISHGQGLIVPFCLL